MDSQITRSTSSSIPLRLLPPDEIAAAIALSSDNSGRSLKFTITTQPPTVVARAMYFDCVLCIEGDYDPSASTHITMALLFDDFQPVTTNIADGVDFTQHGSKHCVRLRVHELTRAHDRQFRALLVANIGSAKAATITKPFCVLSKGIAQRTAGQARTKNGKKAKKRSKKTYSSSDSDDYEESYSSESEADDEVVIESGRIPTPSISLQSASMELSNVADSALLEGLDVEQPYPDTFDIFDQPMNAFSTPLAALLAPATAFMPPVDTDAQQARQLSQARREVLGTPTNADELEEEMTMSVEELTAMYKQTQQRLKQVEQHYIKEVGSLRQHVTHLVGQVTGLQGVLVKAIEAAKRSKLPSSDT